MIMTIIIAIQIVYGDAIIIICFHEQIKLFYIQHCNVMDTDTDTDTHSMRTLQIRIIIQFICKIKNYIINSLLRYYYYYLSILIMLYE